MALLTGKQRKNKATKNSVGKPSADSKKISQVEVPKEIEPIEIFEYLLFHPENPSDGYLNYRYTDKIDGKDETINIQNGQVRTVMENIAKHLMKSGYILIHKIKLKE